LECAEKVVKLINNGSTYSAVNFPQVELPLSASTHRILNVHRNVPGVLKAINTLLADVNVSAQILGTHKSVGYIILDVEQQTSDTLKRDLASLPSSLRTRILY
jgi:D-3-phosphoglycerate dehydrogenase